MTCCSRHLLPRYVHHHTHSTCTLFLSLLDVCCGSYSLLNFHCSGWAYSISARKVDSDSAVMLLGLHLPLLGLHLPHPLRKLSIGFCHIWVGVGILSITYITIVWAMGGCFALCHQTVEWQWGGSACSLIRDTSPTPALKDRVGWRNDLTSPSRDSNILPPEYETTATFGSTV
jgi:hypothetical protein